MASTAYRIRASDIPTGGVQVIAGAIEVAIESARERGGSVEALCWTGYEPRFAWQAREIGGYDAFRCAVYNGDKYHTNTGIIGYGRSR